LEGLERGRVKLEILSLARRECFFRFAVYPLVQNEVKWYARSWSFFDSRKPLKNIQIPFTIYEKVFSIFVFPRLQHAAQFLLNLNYQYYVDIRTDLGKFFAQLLANLLFLQKPPCSLCTSLCQTAGIFAGFFQVLFLRDQLHMFLDESECVLSGIDKTFETFNLILV